MSNVPRNDASGFSMVELMVTVVIITVCLLAVFRVFSICARALSETSYTITALSVLEEKMSLLREGSAKNDGVLTSSSSESLKVDNKRLIFTQDIIEWSTGEDEEEEIKLCNVKLGVRWKTRGRERRLSLNTFLPIEGCAHEF